MFKEEILKEWLFGNLPKSRLMEKGSVLRNLLVGVYFFKRVIYGFLFQFNNGLLHSSVEYIKLANKLSDKSRLILEGLQKTLRPKLQASKAKGNYTYMQLAS